jgi:hypothetical protein
MLVPSNFAKVVQRIINSYPKYVKVDKLQTEETLGIKAFINELAFLQVFVV